jgi:hypothetical protein
MDHFEMAYVVSDDSDIIPAIEKLRQYAPSKKIVQVTFAPRVEWRKVCASVVQLYENKMKKFRTTIRPTAATMGDLLSKFGKR